jgi:hypothetical protein
VIGFQTQNTPRNTRARKWDYTSNIRITKQKHTSFHQQFLNTWRWPVSVETCSAMYRRF